MNRNTKIVATYGPAVAREETLEALIDAGANVIRLNFSHGDYDDHAAAIEQIRRITREKGRSVALLQDLRGPKIRVGVMQREPWHLEKGSRVILATQSGSSDETLPIEGCPTLGADIQTGEAILLDDGAIRLEAREISGGNINCDVIVGGDVRSRKGVNFPHTKLASVASLTEKDLEDLAFGLARGVDWVALSFVRSADDVRLLKERIAEHGSNVPVIAKIEKREALSQLEEIVDAADGIMVARGDLGVETDLEEVVLRQKEIIRTCNHRGRVVITATQMLESMIKHASPTRAEVSDVSNAIFDGTDAIMLSGETAVGDYPCEAVAFMNRVAIEVEKMLDAEHLLAQRPFLPEVSDAVAHAACVVAHEIKANALICLTRSGLTARLVSRYRPRCPVIAVSPEESTVRRLAVQWGVIPVHSAGELEGEALVGAALTISRTVGLVGSGDRVVITAGVGSGELRGKTNLIRVEAL